MIVVTGPGRSGTSVVASLYRELGFDPGGDWYPTVRAGLEARDIVDANRRIAKGLRLGRFEGHSRRRSLRRSLRAAKRRLRRSGRPPLDAPLDWSRLGAVVERHGERLRGLARSTAVAKDPRFMQTLGVWAAAGADIEHVLVCVRPLDEMVASRLAAGHAGRASPDVVRDAIVYSLGLCLTALVDHELDHAIVRFPDFVRDPDALYAAMRFPEPVSREQFLDAFAGVVRPELVTPAP